MGRYRTPEELVQEPCMQFLDCALPPDAFAWHVPNGRMVTKICRQIGKAMGVKSGIYDIHILWRGRLIIGEVKPAKGGKLSPEQVAMGERFTLCGAVVCPYPWTSVEVMVGFLETLQIPLRARFTA